MMPGLPTKDQLKKLPLRAIVAYAVRCARRVQPLYRLARRIPDRERHQAAIETILMIGERFCRDETAAAANAFTAGARTFSAARVTGAADAAARAARAASAARAANATHAALVANAARAASAAAEAANAAEATETVEAANVAATNATNVAATNANAAGADYDRLVSLNLGVYPNLGQPIDLAENGPLGPLWPEVPPKWFT